MNKHAWRCALCHLSGLPHRRRDICDDCGVGLAVRSLAWCSRGRHRVPAGTMRPGRSICGACDRARSAAHYARNQAERQAKQRAYYAANRDRELEQDRQYRADHAERINARRRELRAAQRSTIRARQQRYYQAHRAEEIERVAGWRKDNPGRHAHYCRVWRARQKLRTLRGISRREPYVKGSDAGNSL